MATYATATEVRNYTNVSSQEYSDTQINQMVTSATNIIDLMTGRTWQGVVTKSNQYYDGNGTTKLNLGYPDLASVTALSIDDNFDTTYTTVDTTHVLVRSNGYIILNTSQYPTIAVSSFTKGRNTVKVSFTYGYASATEDVKLLCILMVANMLRMDPERRIEIDRLINSLKYVSIASPDDVA